MRHASNGSGSRLVVQVATATAEQQIVKEGEWIACGTLGNAPRMPQLAVGRSNGSVDGGEVHQHIEAHGSSADAFFEPPTSHGLSPACLPV